MSQGERKARPLARFLVSELVIRHWSLVSLVIRHSAESVILSAAKDLRGIERPFHSSQILQSLSLHQDDMRARASSSSSSPLVVHFEESVELGLFSSLGVVERLLWGLFEGVAGFAGSAHFVGDGVPG